MNQVRQSGLLVSFARRERAFALVATICLLVLVALICVGLLSLSTLSLRGGQQAEAQARAESNARLALLMALGQLQKTAGNDQRVTACGEIVDQATPEKGKWTGVWSTEDWKPTDPNKRTFVQWLVSDSQKGQTPLPESAVTQVNSGNALVTLVGQGSAGAAPENHVKVQSVPMDSATGAAQGAYAYWVGDQGVKGSYALTKRGAEDLWKESSQLSVVNRVGVEASKVTALENYKGKTPEEISKAGISFRTIDTAHQAQVGVEVFHDISPRSVGLLTDTRMGGIARDLSTAFELPIDQFNGIKEFHATNEVNDTNFYSALSSAYMNDKKFYPSATGPRLGFLTEIRQGSNLFRGPTWDLLRNHYRFYKKDWDQNGSWARGYNSPDAKSFASRGSLPLSYSRGVGGTNPQGVFNYRGGPAAFYGRAYKGGWASVNDLLKGRTGFNVLNQNSMLHTQSPRLVPIVARVAVGLGLVRRQLGGGDWNLAVSFDPYVTIVNPYNVPITFQSIGIFASKFNPLRVNVKYTDRNDGTQKDVTDGSPFSQNYLNTGSFAFRLVPPNGSGVWSLQPGEVKVISPAQTGGKMVQWTGVNGVRGQFDYSEKSGLYWNLNVKPRDGTSFDVKFMGQSGDEEIMYVASIHYTKDHNGGARDVMTFLPPANMFGDDDIIDDPLVAKIGLCSNPNGPEGNFEALKSANVSQIPNPSEGALYVAVMDTKLKSGKANAPTFWLNPRGQAFDTRDYDGGSRTGPHWQTELLPINDLADLQIVGDPAGHGYWGDGYTAVSGTSNVVLYEVPQLPMTSLGQFQHADISVTGSGGSLQLGNSFAHPGIANRTQIYGKRTKPANAYNSNTNPQSLGDLAWAGNEMLWDRYFFSGMNWGGTSFAVNNASQAYATQDAAVDALLQGDPAAKYPLMNPRIVMWNRTYAMTKKDELKEYNRIGKYLAVEGGFNVNSTSERAWRVLFSTLRNADVKYVSNGSMQSKQAANAFSRFTIPVAANGSVWGGGYHELTDAQIDELAKAMVEQVKERGPFMGLADFVNRRLDAGQGKKGTDVGVLGALQAAIEKAGLNNRPEVSNPVSLGNMEHKSYNIAGAAQRFSTYVGAPGYVMQGDILSTLGSVLRARSDTFLIRSYGEARDNAGKVIARAWCEATVQRSPYWTQDTSEEPAMEDPSYETGSPSGDVVTRPWKVNPAFPQINKTYGRSFQLTSFRWLNKNEV